MATSTNTARLIIRKRAAPNFLAKKVKTESNFTSSSASNLSSDTESVLSENDIRTSKIIDEVPNKKISELNNKESILPKKSESSSSSEAASDFGNSTVTSSSDIQRKPFLENSESRDSQVDNLNDVEPNDSPSLCTIKEGVNEETSKTLDSSKSDSESTSLEIKTLKKRCAPILPKKRQLPNINLSSQKIPKKSDSPSVHHQKEDATILSDKIDHPLVAPSHTDLTSNQVKEGDNINNETISAKTNIENQDFPSNQELSVDSKSNGNSNLPKEEKRPEPQSKNVSSKPLLNKRALPVLPRKRPAPNLSSQAKENLVNSSKEIISLKIDETVSEALLSEGPRLKQLKVGIDNNAQPSESCPSLKNQTQDPPFRAEENKIDSVETAISSSITSENSVTQSASINENDSFKSGDQNINQEIKDDVKDTNNKNTVQKFLKKRVGPKLVDKNLSKVPKISTNDRDRKDKIVRKTDPLISSQDVLENNSKGSHDYTLPKSLPNKSDHSIEDLSSESKKKDESKQNDVDNYKHIARDKHLQFQNETMDEIPDPCKSIATKELDQSRLEDNSLNLNKEKRDSISDLNHISNDKNSDSLGRKNLSNELSSKPVSPTSDFSEKSSNIAKKEFVNSKVQEESEKATTLCIDEDQHNISEHGEGSTSIVSSESDISKKPYKLRLKQPVKNTFENSDDEIVEDIFSNSENSDDSEYTAELESYTSKQKIEKPKQQKKKTIKKKNRLKDGTKKERKPRKKTDVTEKEGNPKMKAEKKIKKAIPENPSAYMKLGMEVKNKNKWDDQGNCAEPEKLELKDFIFFVPKNVPMSRDSKKETKVSGGEEKEEEIRDGEEEVEESHGPKLIVKDGKIMVDPNSTKIKQTPVVHGKVEKIEKPREPNDPWELLETMKFYATLWKYGIDFSMLAGTFPKKSRDSIKKKFNFEEKNNNLLMAKTLTKKLDIKAILRELILIDSLEKVTRKKIGSNKPPKEPRKAKKHCLLHKKKIVRNNENKPNNIDLLSFNGEASNQSMSSCISDNESNIGEGMNLLNLKDVITFSTNVVYKDMNIIESVSFHPSAIQPVDVNVTIRHDPEEASSLQPQPVTQDTSLK